MRRVSQLTARAGGAAERSWRRVQNNWAIRVGGISRLSTLRLKRAFNRELIFVYPLVVRHNCRIIRNSPLPLPSPSLASGAVVPSVLPPPTPSRFDAPGTFPLRPPQVQAFSASASLYTRFKIIMLKNLDVKTRFRSKVSLSKQIFTFFLAWWAQCLVQQVSSIMKPNQICITFKY